VKYDVCVIGAGPAAAASAIAAHSTGATVALVGATRRTIGGTLELLSANASDILIGLGLYDRIRDTADPCGGTVCRWFDSDFVERSSLLEPRGGGWIVDRAVIDPLLLSEVAARGVRVISERALGVDPDYVAGNVDVRTRRGSLSAATVVVAVGRGTGIVRRISRRTLRRRMVALTMTLGPGAIDGLGCRLLVDRAPNGWWYALAGTRTTSVVYCVDADTLTSMRGALPTWQDGCRAASDWLPGGASRRAPRARAACIGSARPVAQHAVRLVGDAALTVDPLSGHGLTLAFESATRWADADYADWSANTEVVHTRQERETYRAVTGAVGAPFWSRRGAHRVKTGSALRTSTTGGPSEMNSARTTSRKT
jgi:flavin-dependent dehydrogenase